VTNRHGDHLGSTTPTTGATASKQFYLPYGAQRTVEQVAANYCFTGQRWEEAIGLYDYKERWYGPEEGNPQIDPTPTPTLGHTDMLGS
jgi:hypothetical protein